MNDNPNPFQSPQTTDSAAPRKVRHSSGRVLAGGLGGLLLLISLLGLLSNFRMLIRQNWDFPAGFIAGTFVVPTALLVASVFLLRSALRRRRG